jgi:hypothetical protein
MGYASRAGRARTSPTSPQAHAICDRCGFRYNRVDLRFQMDWAGAVMVNKRLLVCDRCYDEPQAQLRAFVIPADPVPVSNPRPENFDRAAVDRRATSGLDAVDPVTDIPIPGGETRVTQDDDTRVTQQTGAAVGSLNDEPGTDPNVDGSIGLPPGNTSISNTGPL